MDMGQDLGNLQAPLLLPSSTNSTCIAIDDYQPPSSLPTIMEVTSNNNIGNTRSNTTTDVMTGESKIHTQECMLLHGKAIEARIKLYGGQVSPHLRAGVTHVMIQPTICHPSRLIEIKVSVR